MSYRERSYRKVCKAVTRAQETGPSSLSRAQMDRVMHWSGMKAMPKSWGWGKPSSWRA